MSSSNYNTWNTIPFDSLWANSFSVPLVAASEFDYQYGLIMSDQIHDHTTLEYQDNNLNDGFALPNGSKVVEMQIDSVEVGDESPALLLNGTKTASRDLLLNEMYSSLDTLNSSSTVDTSSLILTENTTTGNASIRNFSRTSSEDSSPILTNETCSQGVTHTSGGMIKVSELRTKSSSQGNSNHLSLQHVQGSTCHTKDSHSGLISSCKCYGEVKQFGNVEQKPIDVSSTFQSRMNTKISQALRPFQGVCQAIHCHHPSKLYSASTFACDNQICLKDNRLTVHLWNSLASEIEPSDGRYC